MRVRIATDTERDRFNAFAAASPAADLLQSWEWGEIKRTSGWSPRRYLVEDGDRILATASVLRIRPLRGVPPILYAPRGPVWNGNDAALRALADDVRANATGGFVLKCDPPVEAGSPDAGALATAGFRRASSGSFGGVQPKAVMVLDITPDEEKIMEGFKSKWRYNIRVAERKGVEVASAARDEIPVFYDLLRETAARDGFLVRGRSYFETLYDTLAPKDMLGMFLTRFEGQAIAGAICFAFGNRVTYVYGASSNEHRNVMPNHLMQWHMIRWARSRGAQIYDFRGVSPVGAGGAPAESHIAGLNRFKEGFGARYVEYAGEHDLPLRPLVWRAWVAGAPAAMKLYKKIKGGGAED